MVYKQIDYRLIAGFFLAHLLIFSTFQDKAIFWYIFSGSLLILTIWAITQEEVDDNLPFSSYSALGAFSGLLLFAIFFAGSYLIELLQIPVADNIDKLYQWFSPKQFWQYIALVLIAVPGEELFWRGFIQKRLHKKFQPLPTVFISSIMYASVNIYSGEWILVFAAFFSGLVWGLLFAWKKSMPLIIVSNLIFDLMLFIIMPLN